MSELTSDSPRDPATEAAAAEWLVKHDAGLTPAQQDEFLQWLAAAPGHRESFQRHKAMWRDFDALAQWRPEHSAEPNPDLLARPKRARVLRWVAPVVLAAVAGLAVIFWLPSKPEPALAAPLAFEAEAYRQETLFDGTLVDLNRGAHLVVQFSANERRVVLVQGEAQFNVAKNPAKPFVVRAGGVDVRAIGTAFNVKLAGTNLEVLVTEGTVHVAQQTVPTEVRASSVPRPAAAVLAALSAGERTVISVAQRVEPPVVVAASPQEVERLLEWKPRLFDFDATPLAEVVAAFNRRNATQLVLGDEALRNVPIVASIRSDNVDGFVHMLEMSLGIRSERSTENQIVLRRK